MQSGGVADEAVGCPPLSTFDLRRSTSSDRSVRTRIWITAALLAVAIAVLHGVSRGERVPLRQPLGVFPFRLGEWTGRQWPVEPRLLAAAGVDDSLSRYYADGRGNLVELYIGYYRSQRNGDVIHSPRNCLPATGWEPLRAGRLRLDLAGGKSIVVNDYTVAKGLDRERVFYWYQARGRVVASEYWGKVWLVADAITRDRTDCALVRIMTAETGEQESRARLLEFARLVYPHLGEFVPD